MRTLHWMMTLAALWLAGAPAAHAQVDLAPYLKRDVYETIKISPDGKHYAATMPMEDRTAIVMLSRADKRVVSGAAGEKNSAVHDFWWVDDKRIVIAMAETFGSRTRPTAPANCSRWTSAHRASGKCSAPSRRSAW